MKLDREPRLTSGSTLFASLVDWARMVAQAVNGNEDAAAASSTAAIAAAVALSTPPGIMGYFARASAPAGWVAADGGTIGNVGSGATRANADTLALFTLWWTDYSNAQLPILTSAGGASTRGASAAADWAALKRLTVFDERGIFPRGASGAFVNGTLYPSTEIIDNGGASGTAVVVLTSQAVVNGEAGTNPTTGYNLGALGAGATSGSLSSKTIRPVNRPKLACFKL